jgi:hypothetical protein
MGSVQTRLKNNMSNDIAKWIWFDGKSAEVNSYVDFRQEFEIADELLQAAELRVSCETNFAVWLNGKFVGTGQFGDYPGAETYSAFDLSGKILAGSNVLAVSAYHCGINNASYIAAEPALWFELRIADEPLLCSGKATMSRISPVYRQGEMKRSTLQMGFSFEADMRQDDQWRELEYKTAENWYFSKEISACQPEPRPLPLPVIRKRTPFQIIAQGILKRAAESGTESLMQHDYLSARRNNEVFANISAGEIHYDKPATVCMEKNTDADGVYLLVDMQREECGFIELELDAPAGMIVDLAVGEHLADLRVRASVGGRTFSSRLITKKGKQRFTHYITRAAGRYLQLHFTGITEAFTLEYAGMLPFEYPLAPCSEFNCADSLFNKIYEVSCRTLDLCMHEHYEDCPWREQALYANDSRNQALTAYYTFGEYAFPAVSFELLGRSAGDDGYLTLCAPMASPFTIPSFTMVWFLALADHLRYSGDFEYAKASLPLVHKCLACFIRTVKNNLLPSPVGSDYWHFYDWADGLSGAIGASPSTDLNEERYDAPLNFLFILALKAAAEICEACGEAEAAASYREKAANIAGAAHEMFWNPEKQLYCTGSSRAMQAHFAELTQAFALLTESIPPAVVPELRARLAQADNGMVKTTLSQCFYKFEALMQEKEKYGSTVFSRINEDWSKMLYAGAGSFWETEQGQADFAYAGSLCHGWSATPAYFFGAYILGVKPLSPGFKTFAVEPVAGEIRQVSGSIPTPSGDIKVSWHINIDEQGNKSPQGKIIYPDCLSISSKPEYLKLEPYSVNF